MTSMHLPCAKYESRFRGCYGLYIITASIGVSRMWVRFRVGVRLGLGLSLGLRVIRDRFIGLGLN